MADLDKDRVLKKTIKLKSRTLKPYEKKFRRQGEYRYDLPIQSRIPAGHPKVCYDRSAKVNERECGNSSSANAQPSEILSTASRCHLHLPENALTNAESCDDSTVQSGKYVIIERKSKDFNGTGWQWMYWCSCNENKARQLAGLEHRLNLTYEEFTYQYPDCDHIQVARLIYDKYDFNNEILPLADRIGGQGAEHRYAVEGEILFEVPDSKIVCCLGENSSRGGLVSFEKNISCLTCSGKCSHVSTIKRIMNEDHDNIFYDLIRNMTSDTAETTKTNSSHKHSLISYKKIPFTRSDSLYEGLRKFTEDMGSFLLPENDTCIDCGAALQDRNPIEEDWVAYEHAAVVTNTTVNYVKVYYRPCSSCPALSMFEGQSKCLLNLGTYLVGYDVLRSYMHSFLHGRRPLYTFYKTWCDVYFDYKNFTIQVDLSYERLRQAWLSYLKLLDIDFNEGFSCPHCDGDDGMPETIICDGTTLSFQRRMWDWNEEIEPENVLTLSSSKFIDRVFIEDVLLRNYLKRFACNGEIIRGVKHKLLDKSERKKLFTDIKEVSEPLFSILKEIEAENSLLKVYQKLLFCLSSPSSVCSLIKPVPEVQSILETVFEVQNKDDPVLATALHEKIPIIFEIFEHNIISDNLKKLLVELWQISISAFVDATEDNCKEETVLKDDQLSFFPALKKYRNRGTFQIDGNRKQKKKTKADNCQKRYPGHPSLLPGIFTMFCPHGKVDNYILI
ncbi:unnamed protein product [Mytilus coruscus]|uniref:Uncharacterized protein n=1 Tax=Mytilus coruscus TaxID=42192 RepID=A0A6J8BVI4_MYTCO|nr:unnamed protein product [Mytilus coruscus]